MEQGAWLPKWIAWEATRRCNLACIHCRAAEAANCPGGPLELDTMAGMALIDGIAAFCKPVLVLSGGEPLLRPDLFELAAHGTERGLRMAIATNGTLVDDGICRRMKESGIRIASLSLDGPAAAVHDDFRRQPGAFAGTLKAAEAFRRNGIEFIVNSSFTRRNMAHIPAVKKLAKELGAKAWYLFMVVPTGRGAELLGELIGPEDYERILKWHYEMERGEPEMLVRPTCAPQYYRLVRQLAKARGEKFEPRSLSFSTGGAKGCVAGQSIVFIDASGEVRPCSYFPVSAGSLRRRSFKDIWENSELLRSLRDFKSYKGRCGSCEYIKVCGGCRARALLMSGDHLAEEPMCAYVPLRLGGARGGA